MKDIILILGFGKSTQTAITVLQKQYTAEIWVYDESLNKDEANHEGVRFISAFNEIPLQRVVFCLKSPGIPYTKEYVRELERQNIELLTDVELFLTKTPGKVIAITGTNGKTTVTTMVGEVLKQKYQDVRVCGNIGIPIAEVCENATAQTLFVVELSSFQLKGTKQFKPDVALVLNMSDAHLDYHETFEDYQKSKQAIFSRQNDEDILLYNGDDEVVAEMAAHGKANCLQVGQSPDADVAIKRTEIVFCNQHFPLEAIHVPGIHNQYNAAFAFAIGSLFDVSLDEMIEALSTFSGVRHRLQYVGTDDGIKMYNDSKSTNEIAVKTALQAFKTPTIWLCGGYDRKIPYQNITEADVKNVKQMVVFGEMADTYRAVAEKWGIPYAVEMTFSELLKTAMKYAEKGDTILFSPGAASYDQFQNFEQRGDAFIELVTERLQHK